MKVISQAVEEEIKRTGSEPYATVQDRRSINPCYGGPHRKVGCYTVVVNEKDVWGESNARQSSNNSHIRCLRLVRLLQEAYDKGYTKGYDFGYFKRMQEREKPKEEEEMFPPAYPLSQVPIPEGWEQCGFREPKFDEYFLTETGGIGYQDGSVSFKGREAEHIIVRNEGEKNDNKDV